MKILGRQLQRVELPELVGKWGGSIGPLLKGDLLHPGGISLSTLKLTTKTEFFQKFSTKYFCVKKIAQEDERGNLLSTSYNATMAKASFQRV